MCCFLKAYLNTAVSFSCSATTAPKIFLTLSTNKKLTESKSQSIFRGVSRAAATSKMERFVIIVNGFQLEILTHFNLMFNFYNPWKHQKTSGFLEFLEDIEIRALARYGLIIWDIKLKSRRSQMFFITGVKACNFIKKRPQHRCFPVNIDKSLKAPFFKKHYGGCFWFLNFVYKTWWNMK